MGVVNGKREVSLESIIDVETQGEEGWLPAVSLSNPVNHRVIALSCEL